MLDSLIKKTPLYMKCLEVIFIQVKFLEEGEVLMLGDHGGTITVFIHLTDCSKNTFESFIKKVALSLSSFKILIIPYSNRKS